MAGTNLVQNTTAVVEIYSPVPSGFVLHITDISGKVGYSSPQLSSQQGWNTVQLPELPASPGLYHITCTTPQGSRSIRFIKQ